MCGLFPLIIDYSRQNVLLFVLCGCDFFCVVVHLCAAIVFVECTCVAMGVAKNPLLFSVISKDVLSSRNTKIHII